jgi:aerobic-type carbon monoxide dehydrogenase small subunit (CoxS/CutS family)
VFGVSVLAKVLEVAQDSQQFKPQTVTVTVFSNLQCSFCPPGRAAEAVMLLCENYYMPIGIRNDTYHRPIKANGKTFMITISERMARDK